MLRTLAIATVASLMLLAAPGTTAAGGSATVSYYSKNVQDWSGDICATDDPAVIQSSWGVACTATGVSGTVTAVVSNTATSVSVRLTGVTDDGTVCTAAKADIGRVSLTLADGCTNVTLELGVTATTGTVALSWA